MRYLIRRTAVVLMTMAMLTIAGTPAMAETCIEINDWTIICVDIFESV